MPKSYYNYNKISSFNGTFNMIIGARGLGKSFGAKVKAVKDAIKDDNKKFILLRRFRTELPLTKSTFFTDIQDKFPDWEFRCTGVKAEIAHVSTQGEKKRSWKHIGYFFPLTSAQTFKSVSFADVDKIIFDEFIIESDQLRYKQYIKNEANVFINFYNTVDRAKDKTKVWMLANSVAVNNPYFISYKIEPKDADEFGFIKKFYDDKTGLPFMVIHLPESKDFENEVYQTAFGKFIEGTEYADYAVGNEFSDNSENLIKEKDPKARYMYTLETSSGTFSIWHSMFNNEYYCGARRVGNENIFTLIPDRMNDDRTLLVRNDKMIQRLRTAFNHGRVWFDRAPTRNAFLEVFK